MARPTKLLQLRIIFSTLHAESVICLSLAWYVWVVWWICMKMLMGGSHWWLIGSRGFFSNPVGSDANSTFFRHNLKEEEENEDKGLFPYYVTQFERFPDLPHLISKCDLLTKKLIFKWIYLKSHFLGRLVHVWSGLTCRLKNLDIQNF